MVIGTFICPHFKLKENCEEFYCRQCKSLIFSVEETQREEMKLNKKYVTTIKNKRK